MFIYNVTVKIDWSIHDAWVKWMLDDHFTEMMNTGCFTQAQLLRLLDTDETEGPTYAAQYFSDAKADYNRYVSIYSAHIRKKYSERWGHRFVAFRTLMQAVEKTS
jgi:hypothetical protein